MANSEPFFENGGVENQTDFRVASTLDIGDSWEAENCICHPLMVLFFNGYNQIKVANCLLPTSSAASKLGFHDAFDLADACFEGFAVHQANIEPSSSTEASKQINAI